MNISYEYERQLQEKNDEEARQLEEWGLGQKDSELDSSDEDE
jgi:hypothetical protein